MALALSPHHADSKWTCSIWQQAQLCVTLYPQILPLLKTMAWHGIYSEAQECRQAGVAQLAVPLACSLICDPSPVMKGQVLPFGDSRASRVNESTVRYPQSRVMELSMGSSHTSVTMLQCSRGSQVLLQCFCMVRESACTGFSKGVDTPKWLQTSSTSVRRAMSSRTCLAACCCWAVSCSIS